MKFSSPHRRRDLTAGRWVTMAPDHNVEGLIGRWRNRFSVTQPVSTHIPSCYCCNKEFCNPDIAEWQIGADSIRMTTHKSIDLTVQKQPEREAEGPYDVMTSYGVDETVVIGNNHSLGLHQVNTLLLAHSLRACRYRMRDLNQDPHLQNIIFGTDGNALFNGSGYVHPRWHISSKATVFPRVAEEIASYNRYTFGPSGKDRCAICDMIRFELQVGRRIVRESPHFLIMAPFASRYPFEMRILPKSHQSFFESDASDQENQELAELIQDLLISFGEVVGERVPYTLVLHNAPVRFRGIGVTSLTTDAIRYMFHWFLRFKPSLMSMSYETESSGETTNPLLPETAAAILQQRSISNICVA